MFTLKTAVATILAMIAQQSADQKDFQLKGELSGIDSAIERPAFVTATTQAEFNEIWRTHKEIFGDPQKLAGVTNEEGQVPKIDFKKHMVFAYFAGQTQGVAGFRVSGVDAKGKIIKVRIAPVPLQTQAQIAANAFGMWEFPKPKKPVEFELLVGVQNGKPLYRSLGLFEPTK